MTAPPGSGARDPIHLDTNFLIGAGRAGSDEERSLLAWLAGGRAVAVSAAAWAEYLVGPVSPAALQAATAIVGSPVPLRESEAVLAADCYNAAGRRRGSMVDCMIAATAIMANAELATANVADFARLVPLGLRLVR